MAPSDMACSEETGNLVRRNLSKKRPAIEIPLQRTSIEFNFDVSECLFDDKSEDAPKVTRRGSDADIKGLSAAFDKMESAFWKHKERHADSLQSIMARIRGLSPRTQNAGHLRIVESTIKDFLAADEKSGLLHASNVCHSGVERLSKELYWTASEEIKTIFATTLMILTRCSRIVVRWVRL